MGNEYEERKAALVLIWTEEGRADEVAQNTSTKRIVDGGQRKQVTAIVRWAAASSGERSDAPDVIAGVSATDEAAIERLVDVITREVSGLRNPQNPEIVHVSPRFEEGWQRPHNGWP